MSLKKHGLKALGLSLLAALGLMAIIAPGASATETDFLVNGSATLNASATGEIDLLGVLLVPAVNLEIDCATLVMEEGNLIASTGHGQVKLLYEGCKAYVETPILTHHTFCLIYPTAADRTALTNEGKIIAKALLLALTHTGGVKIVKAEPVPPSTIFAKIFFKECSINSVDIGGTVDLSLHLGGNNVKHLVQETNVGLSQLKYGTNNAFLDGAAWVKLKGAHAGMTWGIL